VCDFEHEITVCHLCFRCFVALRSLGNLLKVLKKTVIAIAKNCKCPKLNSKCIKLKAAYRENRKVILLIILLKIKLKVPN